MQPNFFNHLVLISVFELKRGFATRKSILPLVTFVVVWYFILLYPIRFAAELLVQEKELQVEFSFFDLLLEFTMVRPSFDCGPTKSNIDLKCREFVRSLNPYPCTLWRFMLDSKLSSSQTECHESRELGRAKLPRFLVFFADEFSQASS